MENYADAVKIHYQYHKNPSTYKKFIHNKFSELPNYTDDMSIVLYDREKRELVYAMRGLDAKKIFSRDANEISTLIDIILSDAYKTDNLSEDKGIRIFKANKQNLLREEKKLNKLRNEYPKEKIILAGHSRGGKKAIELSGKYNLEHHVFNPAESEVYGDKILKLAVNTLMPGSGIEKQIISSAINSNTFKDVGKKFMKIEGSGRKIDSVLSNVYRTKSDLVSRGFGENAVIIQDKEYAKTNQIQEKIIGTHSIDHFISKDLFDAVQNNEEINQEEIAEEEPFKTNATASYSVNVNSLCRQNPRFSPYCKYFY